MDSPVISPATEDARRPAWRIRLSLLACALIGSLFGTSSYESVNDQFEPVVRYPANYESLDGREKSMVRTRAKFEARVANEQIRAVVGFALLSLWIVPIFGLAGRIGRIYRPVTSALLAAPIAASLASAGLSYVLVPKFFDVSDAQTGLPLLLLMHWAIFGAIGVCCGLAYAAVHGERSLVFRCVVGGILGALFGALIAEIVNFVAFPNLRMFEPVPVNTLGRYLLNSIAALGIALGVGLIGVRRKRVRKAT
jgi:hypothetical protein